MTFEHRLMDTPHEHETSDAGTRVKRQALLSHCSLLGDIAVCQERRAALPDRHPPWMSSWSRKQKRTIKALTSLLFAIHKASKCRGQVNWRYQVLPLVRKSPIPAFHMLSMSLVDAKGWCCQRLRYLKYELRSCCQSKPPPM